MKGDASWALLFKWPNGRTAQALELHPSQGAEVNIWAPLSTIKPGEWAKAIKSIADNTHSCFHRRRLCPNCLHYINAN